MEWADEFESRQCGIIARTLRWRRGINGRSVPALLQS